MTSLRTGAFLGLLIWALLASASTHTERELRLHAAHQEVYLSNLLWLAPADPEHNTIETVIGRDALSWQQNHQGTINLGLDERAWWIRLNVHNADGQPLERILDVSYPLLDHVDVYLVRGKEVISQFTSGDSLPLSSRPIRHRHFLFPVRLEADTHYTLYLRVQTAGSLQVPVTLWSPVRLFEADQNRMFWQAGFFGIIAVMALYNLILFVFLRERAMLYYSLYVIAIGLAQLELHGFTRQFLWPDAVDWAQIAFPAMASVSIILASLFSLSFLDCRGRSTRLAASVLRATGLSGVLCLTLTLTAPYHTAVSFVVFAIFGGSVLFLLAGGLRWYQGHSSARYFTLGWMTFLVGNVLISLSKGGILPYLAGIEYAPQVGITLEVLLFAFAISHRVQEERHARLETQRRLVRQERELREAREETLKSREAHTRELEQRVSLRTEELKEAMQKLANAQEKLRHISTLDPLTGLRNAAYFNDVLRDEWNRCSRAISPLSLLILDIDNFRGVNQQYSPLAGDELMRQLAHLLEKRIQRAGDGLFKLDGDRFAILLPHTPLEGAVMVAEELCERLAHHLFDADSARIHIHVSVGVASELPTQHADWQSLPELALRALKDAKKGGGNGVSFCLA
ncbi:MAG: diguanylate cyclase [Gammaproteobacteria bacterium]|nr:MAG: diguanylate cyclase [Gammaproteobacteria bacterium]